ncbi:MAG: BMP family ABC transporter substrate-binding protein [Treponema sp.]|nr:BMP family ABC transporter substrate-binding protein [Treponema sp.]
MKKIITLLCTLFAATLVFAMGTNDASSGKSLRVGMVTDAGTIDDKSFNQGAWEGIVRAQKELGISCKYLKPSGTTEADYLKEISNLADAGYQMIVCPGYKFETAVYVAQDRYPNVKFVILDGQPHSADYSTYRTGSNVAAISWLENQSAFIAGVAAAVHVKEGEFGFIGGMEIPAVQKFNWGWQQGIKYANEHFGTKISIQAKNVVYQGTFTDVAAGQQIAATMFDNGVKVIHAAAGGVGVGVINEAKTRRSTGKDVWCVGVDVDQYNDGIMPNGKSAVLTSAMKFLDRAVFDMIKAELEGTFPGGKELEFTAANDGVGIPVQNPNLSAEAQRRANEAFEAIKSGRTTVAASATGLIK